MPTLEMVNERFARYFRISLFHFLRRAAEISVSGIQIQKFSEFIQGLFVPTNLNVIRMSPLRGRALIVMEPRLVFTAVDNFFGGGGQFYNKVEGTGIHPDRNADYPLDYRYDFQGFVGGLEAGYGYGIRIH